MLNLQRTTILALFTLVTACTPQEAEPTTETGSSPSTGEPSGATTGPTTGATESAGSTTAPDASSSTGDSTGPDATTTTSGDPTTTTTTTPGTTDTDPSATATATTVEESDSSVEESDSDDECASTCGVYLECEHPDVDESLGTPACDRGFHCRDWSFCNCPNTSCWPDCDVNDPKACPGNKICSARTGECEAP